MAVYQTNLHICDSCGVEVSETEQTCWWSDPTIEPPEGWGNVGKDYLDACPKCKAEIENGDFDQVLELFEPGNV